MSKIINTKMRGFASSVLVIVVAFAMIATFAGVFNNASAATGEVNTVSGSCGDPVNVNQYATGEPVLLDGKNFEPGEYAWNIAPVSGGPSAIPIASGFVTADENGNFCFIAIESLAEDTVDGSPYKANVDGKSDNFSVVLGAASTGNITILKSVNDISGENEIFNFASTFPVNGNFSLSGNESTDFLGQDAGDYTITETNQPEGWSFDSISCDSGTWSTEGETLSITILGDEEMTCTFYNTIPVTANTPPILTGNDDDGFMTVTQGDTFTDPGAVCTDAEDGDLTGSIVTGNADFDTSVLGDHVVTYDCTDSDGASAPQVTLTVTVVEPQLQTSTVTLCKTDDSQTPLPGWNLTMTDGEGYILLSYNRR